MRSDGRAPASGLVLREPLAMCDVKRAAEQVESAKLAQELRELRIALDRATHDARARCERMRFTLPFTIPMPPTPPLIPLLLTSRDVPPPTPPVFFTCRSIAAESARAVAAAEEQVRALELETAEAKRDAGELA